MNILHLISSAGFYGAESVVSALTCELRKNGNSTAIGLLENKHRPETTVAAQFEASGTEVIRIPCDGRADPKTVRSIREAIRSKRVDLLHTHGYKADIYGYLAARRSATPVVATCHLWTRQTLAVRSYEFLDSFFLRRFDAVVGVSEAVAHEARRAGIAPQRISTIDNGIDLAPFVNAEPSLRRKDDDHRELLIGTVGRLVEQKGLTYFLQAAQMVFEEFGNVRFTIVGEGPERARLEQLSRELGIAERVVFTGSRSDMANVYASLDLFVLASIDEGMPIVVLEALSAERAVVATRVGAVEKLIVPGDTGLLVEARDICGLRDAMLRCLRDKAFARELGKRGRAHVRELFSAERMAEKYLMLYRQVVEKHSVRPVIPS